MIVVVDYRAGNLYNVGNALKYLGAEFVFSGDPEVVSRAEKVILPGVGSARAAMNSLTSQGLCDTIRALTVPFLGICLGLQLLFDRSEEDDTECLGVLPGTIRRFNSDSGKVPQIGWNQVAWKRENLAEPLAATIVSGLPRADYFYFVHSYFAPLDPQLTIGTTFYGMEYSSAVASRNFLGFQFHPERSGEVGLELLRRFVNGRLHEMRKQC